MRNRMDSSLRGRLHRGLLGQGLERLEERTLLSVGLTGGEEKVAAVSSQQYAAAIRPHDLPAKVDVRQDDRGAVLLANGGGDGRAKDAGFDEGAASAAGNYAPDRLIVRYADSATDADKARLAAAHNGSVVRELPIIDGALIALADAQTDVLQAAAAWSADPLVVYAEPDYRVHATGVPDDLLFFAQWGLHNTGQTGGLPDADVDAPEAWNTVTGSSGVVVASIDSGVDYTHEDLAANMWVNPNEVPGDGIDNDQNGYVDDVYGIDVMDGDTDPMDDWYHGTHTAGVFGAVGNNEIGIAGVNWDVRIMALKFLGPGGGGQMSDAIACLDYMTMMKTVYGVNLVASNNSWGGGAFSQALQDAIQASNEAGIMFVASAGGGGGDNDLQPRYPASYDLDGIIAVAATNEYDNLAPFSNFGASSVDLAAPGVAVLSTMPGNGYEMRDGVSMATPYVTGAVALLAADNPDATLAEVKAAILGGVDPRASLLGRSVSGGRLNLRGALGQMALRVGSPSDLPPAFAGEPYEYVLEAGGGTEPYEWAVVDGQLPAGLTLQQSTGRIAGVTMSLGEATFTVRVSDVAGATDFREFHLPVVARLQITTAADLPDGRLNEPYSVTLQAEGGTPPYVWSTEGAGRYDESEVGPGYLGGGAPLGFQADDSSWPLPLPWSFPFYGAEYDSVNVSSNGFLDFVSSWDDPFNLRSELISNVRIAPYWTDLDTTDGDIYYTPTADYVVVRWDAVTFESSEPTDFEAVLYRNGDIQFNYGPEHLGFTSTPTIGVSNGDNVHYTLSWWDESPFVPPDVSSWFAYGAALPEGLTLDPATGQLRGVPLEMGTFSLTFRVQDDGRRGVNGTWQTKTEEFVLVVPFIEPGLGIRSPMNLPLAYQNEPYLYTLEAGGGTEPYVWAVRENQLPVGLSLDPLTGEISGVAVSPGPLPGDEGSFTVEVTDATLATDTREFHLPVVARLQIATAGDLPDGRLNEPYSVTLVAEGGTPPYAWSTGNAGQYDESDVGPGYLGGGVPLGFQGDDYSWLLSLPWSFPFYGTEYDSVNVSSNGFLDFVSSSTEYINSRSELMSNVRIAPLWDDLFTDFGDIYMTATADYVAVRWDAFAYDTEYQADFEAVLYRNGDIQFNYGLGHFNFTPTIGVSNGDNVHYTISGWDESPLIPPDTSSWFTYSAALPEGLTLDPATGQLHGVPLEMGTFSLTLRVQDDGLPGVNGTRQTKTEEFVLDVEDALQREASTIVISEVQTNDDDAIELTNATDVTIDVSGWQITAYDRDSYPAPQLTFTIPPGTTVAAGEVFVLYEEGIWPGAYPNFYAGSNISWNNNLSNNPVVVVLQDDAGDVVDVVSAVDGFADQITDPVAVPPQQWAGAPVVAESDGSLTYGRIGDEDRNNRRDWDSGAASIGQLNPNLIVPFIEPGLGIRSPMDLPLAHQNEPYQYTLEAGGGMEPYVWAVSEKELPAGLSLDPLTGEISGVAVSTGTASFTVEVTDATLATDTREFHLPVAARLQITTPGDLPLGFLDQPYGVTLKAEGGTSPYVWSLVGADQFEQSDPGPGYLGGGAPMGWWADDASWPLALPWSFPYYGTDYDTIYVSSNGFIDFVVGSGDFENSREELIENVRIAPLWDDLFTDFGDIYVTATADFVAVRWDALTYETWDQADFEAVLYRNGEIQFNYGLEHFDFTPTIGVSNGDNVHYTFSARDEAAFIPPFVSTLFTSRPFPQGLTFDPVTGQLGGAPTETGVFDVTFRVQDGGTPQQTDTRNFVLEVLDAARITVTFPPEATEGDGLLAGQAAVHIPNPLATDLIVSLATSDPTEVSLPSARVTILAGQTSAAFDLQIEEDTILDGSRVARITAAAAGYEDGFAEMSVHDNETAALTLTLPRRAAEDAGLLLGVGILSVSTAVAGDIVVTLYSDDPTEVTVPATVTIPQGQTSITFDVTVVDDSVRDGTQTATVTARVENWTEGSATIDVLNDDASTIVISEVRTDAVDAVELANVTEEAIDVSGWRITVYDWDSYPDPQLTFTIPSGTIVAAGEVFVLNESGSWPGTYPNFSTGSNIFWNNDRSGNPVVVLLQDAAGDVLDVMSAVDGFPAAITDPIAIPPDQWVGAPVLGEPDPAMTYQRFGDEDRHHSGDWQTGVGNLAAPNPDLSVPFIGLELAIRSPADLPLGYVGETYLVTLQAGAGMEPYTWAVIAGELPPGLSLDPSTGEISGLATSVLAATFTVEVTDAALASDAREFHLGVSSRLQITTPGDLPGAFLNLPYSVTLQADGGTPPYHWSMPDDDAFQQSDLASGYLGDGTPMGWRADDASWLLALPWSFPYYGSQYDQVFVSSNGFLDFASNSTDFYSSTSGLLSNVRIAPLWEDLVTTDGDIYVTQTADYVAVRWDAVTWASGVPVDVEVVLYRSGDVKFNYGMEHFGLLPTIGLSAGDNTRYTISTWDGSFEIPSMVSSLFTYHKLLPDGLTFDGGTISGTPTESGSFEARFQVLDDRTQQQTVTRSFTLNVTELPYFTVDLLPGESTDFTEGDGLLVGRGILSIRDPVAGDLTVSLTSSDPTEVVLPLPMVTILGGQTKAAFDLLIVDDGLLDGTQSAEIRVSTFGYYDAMFEIRVHDNETAQLEVILPDGASVSERDGLLAGYGTVTISTAPPVDVVINLSSSDLTEVSVPATVVIPAGQTSTALDVNIVPDAEPDGTQTVTITAHVENWSDGADQIDVVDYQYFYHIILPKYALGDDYFELNNTLETAWPLDEDVDLSSLDEIDHAGGVLVDDDWYQISVTVGAYQLAIDGEIAASGGKGDGAQHILDLELYDADGSLIGSSANRTGSEHISRVVAVAGAGDDYDYYYIRVFGSEDYYANVLGGQEDPTEYDLRWTLESPVQVVGRHVFYNDSSFDDNDPMPNGKDDDAIATDKEALLPGSAATFANYTSYSAGINGIMIDVAGLADGAAVTAADFRFRVGNSNDLSTWSDLAVQPDITLRRDDGSAGSDRITLIWPDNTIQQQWLEVTLLASGNLGLADDDVFYFGNAIGESGNFPCNAIVDGDDAPTPLIDAVGKDQVFDYNRDQRVNANDGVIVENNLTDSTNALRLITPGLVLPATVAGRYVFYNNSAFDGDDPQANDADDDALATDKLALLPGQTATFDNYTSYSRGINGIMVDLEHLGTAAIGPSDFEFRVGNGNDPGTWTSVLDTPTVTVRLGEGAGCSDRVTIVWPDNAIENQWLQVTLRAGGKLGLAADDVFYFGNAVAESGNSAADAKVNAYDMLGARDNQRNFLNPAPIDFKFDFDRDQLVDATDMLLARSHQTHFLNALNLITVPSTAKDAVPSAAKDAVPARQGDASLPDAFARSSPDRKTSRGSLSWLYEFEPAGTRQPTQARHAPNQRAVDALLATAKGIRD